MNETEAKKDATGTGKPANMAGEERPARDPNRARVLKAKLDRFKRDVLARIQELDEEIDRLN